MVFVYIFWGNWAFAGALRFERVMTEGGVSVAETNVITQDQEGYIWIGGSNGLARYDGNQFEVFRHDPKDVHSISNNFVWDILVDSKGQVWVATTSGLNRFHPQLKQFERFRASSGDPGSLINNDVYRLHEDREGTLWVGTRHGLDRYHPEEKSFFHFRHNIDDPNSLSDSSITAMYQDALGKFWVGTAKGLNVYHPQTNSFSLFRFDEGNFYDPNVSIRDLIEDENHNLWVATDNGLYRFSQKDGGAERYVTDAKNPFSLGDNRVWKLRIDSRNQLWVATDRGGLNLYRSETNDFVRYHNNPYDNTSLSSNQVRDIFEDRAGDYWVALFPSGVDFANATSALFETYRYNPENPTGINHDAILSIAPGPNNMVWVGTEGGINLYDPSADTFSHYVHSADPNSLAANAVLAITQDNQGNYWFGTWSGGLNRLSSRTNKFTHYLPKKDNKNSISSPYVWSLMTDRRGNIWIGTEGGALDVLDPDTGNFTHYYPNEKDPNALSGGFIRAILEDHEGDVWIATINGLNRFDSKTQKFQRFNSQLFDDASLPHDSVASLYEDRNQQLWVGTEGGLAKMDKRQGKFSVYTTSDGLPNNSIMGIVGDAEGNLWINTLGGISRFSPKSGQFSNYSAQNGMAGNIMNRPAVYYDPQGFMLVGSTRGLTKFEPSKLKINEFIPPIVMTDFKVFNRSVDVGESAFLSQHINYLESIELNYTENMFSFEFAALNFRNSNENQYRYRMEGFDGQWIQAVNQHSATYTNLNPGTYKFTVMGSNNSGVWNEVGKSLYITILPPPWKTWWAYCIYVAAAFLLLYLFVRSQRKKVLFEQQKVKELRKLDRLKDEFLANTSHELRTPLNGIIGLTDSLLDDVALNLPEKVVSSLKMVSHSGRRLSHLINDILDFSKIKNRGVELSLQPTDFRSLCDAVCMMMRPLAEKKSIRFEVDLPKNMPTVWGDANRLEQILYNLLGNAIKFTFEGYVKVYAEVSEKNVTLFIEDTGIGIPESDLGSIFESFTQAQGHAAREYEGTGLGLAVAKNLVELHGGTISVASELDKGSIFKFNLRVSGESAPDAITPMPENSRLNSIMDVGGTTEDHEVLVAESPSTEHFKFHILVVDDDAINRKVLIGQLSLHNYRISEATNGQEAVEVVRRDSSVDLVLLDVMMPRMTGYQAASEIRAIKPVHELPIIFITAKHLASDLVAGFVAGGNDFLIKPVSKNELLQRTKTHLLLLDVTRNLESIVDERTNTLNQARRSLEAIDNIVNNINQQHSLQGLASVLLEEASALLENASAGAFWLINERREGFKLISTIGDEAKSIFPEHILKQSVIAGASGSLLRSGVYILSPDQVTIIPDTAQRLGSALVTAIETGEGLAGLLVFITKPGGGSFSSADREVMMRLQGHAVSAVAKARLLETLKLQNQKLERLGFTDQLTDLNNRRHLIKYLQGDIALCKRRYQVAAQNGMLPDDADLLFVLIDVDHFKMVNDTYGHNAGDCVLKQFAQLLRQVFRESDHIIRWGGEEFLVVVRFFNRESAVGMVERFRQLVEETEFPISDGTILRKTCSIGFSCFPFFPGETQQYTWEQVVEVADMCLYAAKNSQRNAWVGVSGAVDAPSQITFHELEHNIERFVHGGRLNVQASLADLSKITWSDTAQKRK